MKPVLVFDIETIPDVAGLRRLNELPAELSDEEVAELARAAMADVQHARETVGGSHWSYVIDTAVLVLVAVLIYAAVFRDVPDANQNALNIILGAILGAFGTVVAYHRGSSAGSGRKTGRPGPEGPGQPRRQPA